ncbi:MAG: VOC family protein [Planctomycetales bacterium]|jgi:lactoylglutathione lyase
MKKIIAVLMLVSATAGLTIVATNGATVAEEKLTVEFTRGAIDFGIVCSDVKKSVAFYKDVVGMKEIEGFDVPASLAADAGLVNNHDLHVHVLVTQEAASSSRLKLMQIKEAPGKKVDHEFIHSSLGMSYSTIWVTDIDASLARAAAGNVKPIAKGPVALSNGLFLAVIRDPDGNFVELVGPRRK